VLCADPSSTRSHPRASISTLLLAVSAFCGGHLLVIGSATLAQQRTPLCARNGLMHRNKVVALIRSAFVGATLERERNSQAEHLADFAS
jgi:hypothetical protein